MKYYEAELLKGATTKPAIVAVDDAVSVADAGHELTKITTPYGVSIEIFPPSPDKPIPQDPAIADFVVTADSVVVNVSIEHLFLKD
jgi:hypothetical protein